MSLVSYFFSCNLLYKLCIVNLIYRTYYFSSHVSCQETKCNKNYYNKNFQNNHILQRNLIPMTYNLTSGDNWSDNEISRNGQQKEKRESM